MILIGMFDSPFVRRVAISMHMLGVGFEHRHWSVGKDFELIRQFNPLGRVPTLILDDGEVLMESSAILDHLDDSAGPERALLPRSGHGRRAALRLMALASGAAEKGVAQVYERAFRPAERRHEPWVARCRAQTDAALAELERAAGACTGTWLGGGSPNQADITVACVYTFLCDALRVQDGGPHPALADLTSRCEALPPFVATRLAFDAPSGG